MVSLQRIAIPLFYNSDKDKEFSFNFRQRREALINTDTRRFKIQTSDMGAPPGRASGIAFGQPTFCLAEIVGHRRYLKKGFLSMK